MSLLCGMIYDIHGNGGTKLHHCQLILNVDILEPWVKAAEQIGVTLLLPLVNEMLYYTYEEIYSYFTSKKR